MGKFICVRTCYYLETLFKPGDVLPEGRVPNKHFKDLDAGAKIPEDPIAVTAGDDPRSTKQIIEDLGEHGKKSWSRKKAFAAWKELQKEGIVEKVKAPADKPIKSAAKPISELTPDELDKMGAKEIGEAYGIKWVGKSKDAVIEEALRK